MSLSYELISEPAFEYALVQAGNKKWQQVFGITQGLNHAVGCAVLMCIVPVYNLFSFFPTARGEISSSPLDR